MHIANFALARCMRSCVAFFDVANEVLKRGSIVEVSTTRVAEGFVPSRQWQDRLFDLYVDLSNVITLELDQSDSEADFGAEERKAWANARQGDLYKYGGWVHRILQVINYARRVNGAQTDLGDSEAVLMMKIIEKKLGESRREN